MFRLNERMQDGTQENVLELLEVAMWVALTQHQTGRKFLFEHPAYAWSWSTEMVSFVAGLKGGWGWLMKTSVRTAGRQRS